LRAGSEAQWDELVRVLKADISSSVRRTLDRCGSADADLVEELTQQTFCRLLEKGLRLAWEATASDGEFRSYIRMVASNITYDHLRARRRETAGLPESLPDPKGERMHAAAMLRAVDAQLKTCTRRNPDRDRRIFWLHHGSRLTYKAISAIPDIQMGEKAVESVILRLTRCIRKIFAESQRPEGKRQASPFPIGGDIVGPQH
jgi:RNA polymerase sigma factor (sigma-70 family)